MSIRGWEALLTSVNLSFLFDGLVRTLVLALVANAISFVIAVVVGTYRSQVSGPIAWPAAVYVDVLRNIPVLVLLFFMRFGPPVLGIRLGDFTAALVALALYNSGHLSEIVRAGIASVPREQTVAAQASGLSGTQVFTAITAPQALRNMLPALISQFVILLKATSLAMAIGVIELTRSGQILLTRYANPLEVFTLIALVYLVVNLTLSTLARRTHQRLGGVAPASAE